MTILPARYVYEQVAPQSIPVGLLVTVPTPVPAFAVVRVNPPDGLAHARLENAETPLALTAAT